MYDGGGLQLWREVYDRFNLVPFLCGNTGVQMTGWFKKPIEKLADFNGLKMRIPGLAGRVYQSLGVMCGCCRAARYSLHLSAA